MKLHRIVDVLDELAPPRLAESWDHIGLQVGDPQVEVHRALLCIDLTPAVAQEAMGLSHGGRRRCELVVAYHPPVFQPLAAVTTQTWKPALIHGLIRRGVAVYSPHTALDAVVGGVNDWLCDGLGSGNRRPIRPAPLVASNAYAGPVKLVTFIPPTQADDLRQALSQAGAGQIGAYSACSFNVEGEGTFHGDASTHPRVGLAGRLERVREMRIEMVVPPGKLDPVVAALRRVHPYEEPAFDLYPLLTPPPAPPGAQPGQGRILDLERSIALPELVRRVKRRLGVPRVTVAAAVGPRAKTGRIGLCAGAGGSLLDEAGPLDAFVTGEMRHHDVLDAVHRGIHVILAGHPQTERPYLPTYLRHIRHAVGKGVQWQLSRADRGPSRLV